ncbi:MAG: hypothetical protein A3A73_02815 [Omnitrophica bacterium RIFCSPLOWO2_01_FULL_50_24]|nr:MAG: hypothetical protein A3A73_02815 [Omnitrophica bacterium RIFCSPLOWO2_01_FULL_50_24]
MKKAIALILVLGMVLAPTHLAWAGPKSSAVASALIPGLGQIMNDDHHTTGGKLKIFTMWLVELGAIITTPILASKYEWYIAMIGVSIFALNHWWSASDAYKGAQGNGASLQGSEVR